MSKTHPYFVGGVFANPDEAHALVEDMIKHDCLYIFNNSKNENRQ